VPDSYRAGGSAWTGDARAALERMAATYSDHAPPAEEAYWLAAGYLALSELDIARTYLMEARRLHPSDRRIELITAHLAYKLSDLAEAQAILEKMVREDPGDGLALLNLGIVLSERGDPRSGRVLRDVQRRFAGTPLAGRAGRELSRR
jgi:tetratricopeptide (TPR) repeat protein